MPQFFSDIIQWNCRGIRHKKAELDILASQSKAKVFVLQETKLPEDGTIYLRGFKSFYRNKILQPGEHTAHGGVAILAAVDCSLYEVPLTTRLQAVAISVKLFKRMTICSLYCPPNENSPSFRRDLEELLDQLPKPFLVLGDLNAKNPLWFGDVVDHRGGAIEQILLDRDIYFLDKDQDTHVYHTQQGIATSHIDLSLCSISLLQDFEWGLCEDLMGSDHFPIWLRSGQKSRAVSSPKWILQKADWMLFSHRAVPQMSVQEFCSVQEANNYCQSFITEAAEEAIPKTTGNAKSYRNPWWNPECVAVKSDRRRAWKRYVRGEISKAEWNKVQAKARQTFNWCKKKSWLQFMESINSNTTPKEVWRKIAILNKKYKSDAVTTLRSGNIIVDNPSEIADKLGENFAKISSEANCSPAFLKFKRQNEKNVTFSTREKLEYNYPISREELEYAIAESSDSAVGPDEMHNTMFKKLSEGGKQYILEFFNLIFSEGVLPEDWKLAYIIPILKEAKDPLDPKSYRPISLLSCLSKLFGRIMNKRLVWFLQSNNCLHKAQNGSQKGRSSTDSLVSFETEIHNAFLVNKLLVGILFDLEKAYDTCWGNLILQELHKFGLRGNLPIIMADYLKNRKFQVRVGNKLSKVFNQEMGVPQGGILSVTLFMIAMNTVVECMNVEISFGLYVDDLRVSIMVSRLCTAERLLNLLLQNLQAWMDRTGFKFSLTKTKAIIFRRGPRWCGLQNSDLKLSLGNSDIEVVPVVKFLGILFDEKLTWRPQISKLKRKCTTSLNAIKVMVKYSRTGDRIFLRRIYRTLTRSVFDFGSQVYGTAGTTILESLDPVHHAAIRLWTGAYRTSNKNSLYVEANEPSLANRRLLLDLQFYIRAQKIPKDRKVALWENNTLDYRYRDKSNKYFKPQSFGYKTRQLIRDLDIPIPNITKMRFYKIPPWRFERINICFYLSKFLKSETPDEVFRQEFWKHKHASDLDIFTDGSKTHEKVGSGFIVKNDQHIKKISLRIHDNSSVFIAELFAIWAAIAFVSVSNKQRCTIYSDSRSALQALEKLYSDHPLVQKIQEAIFTANTQGLIISFCWVPGHVGIMGNSLADAVAKAGCFKNHISYNEISASDFKVVLKDKIIQKWQREWDELVISKETQLAELQPLVNQDRLIKGLSRMELLKFTRLRIGHTKFARQYLVKNEEAPECIETGDLFTVKHVLLECGQYYYERRRYFGNGFIDIREILSVTDADKIRNILSFFREIGLFHQI